MPGDIEVELAAADLVEIQVRCQDSPVCRNPRKPIQKGSFMNSCVFCRYLEYGYLRSLNPWPRAGPEV